jgi:hypothetical protein
VPIAMWLISTWSSCCSFSSILLKSVISSKKRYFGIWKASAVQGALPKLIPRRHCLYMVSTWPHIPQLDVGLWLVVGVYLGMMTGDVVIFVKDVVETRRKTLAWCTAHVTEICFAYSPIKIRDLEFNIPDTTSSVQLDKNIWCVPIQHS